MLCLVQKYFSLFFRHDLPFMRRRERLNLEKSYLVYRLFRAGRFEESAGISVLLKGTYNFLGKNGFSFFIF